MSVSTRTLEEAWIKAVRTILTHGEIVKDKEPFKEIRNLQIIYTNAFETGLSTYTTLFGDTYLSYMKRVYSPSGDPDSGRNYHKLIYDHDGVNQVQKVIQQLSEEPYSRSATIVLVDPKAKGQPCVSEINFSIRNALLNMSVIFKSSDVAKKLIPDLIELSQIHQIISQAINVSRGEVGIHILSSQLYERDNSIVSALTKTRSSGKHFDIEKTIENWNSEAKEWDKNIKNPDHYVNIEDGYSRFVTFLDHEIPSARNAKKRALDSGCGTGVIARELARKGYKVDAIDIAPKMLECADRTDSSDITYVRANSLDIPFSDNTFEVICSRGVLISHVGNPYVDIYLKEHGRVLKPGGTFVFDFITKFGPKESANRRNKAALTYTKMVKKLEEHGFEVLNRAGTNNNRVNAISCRKRN